MYAKVLVMPFVVVVIGIYIYFYVLHEAEI